MWIWIARFPAGISDIFDALTACSPACLDKAPTKGRVEDDVLAYFRLHSFFEVFAKITIMKTKDFQMFYPLSEPYHVLSSSELKLFSFNEGARTRLLSGLQPASNDEWGSIGWWNVACAAALGGGFRHSSRRRCKDRPLCASVACTRRELPRYA